jgi:hypothetical protein
LHVVPEQHDCPLAPQPVHVPPEQVSPPLHVVPEQHGWPLAPH